jgi:hypothetical protein
MQIDMLGIFHSRCDANHLYSLVFICCRFCLVTSLVWKKNIIIRDCCQRQNLIFLLGHIFWVV